jgi:hypothetical protein
LSAPALKVDADSSLPAWRPVEGEGALEQRREHLLLGPAAVLQIVHGEHMPPEVHLAAVDDYAAAADERIAGVAPLDAQLPPACSRGPLGADTANLAQCSLEHQRGR